MILYSLPIKVWTYGVWIWIYHIGLMYRGRTASEIVSPGVIYNGHRPPNRVPSSNDCNTREATSNERVFDLVTWRWCGSRQLLIWLISHDMNRRKHSPKYSQKHMPKFPCPKILRGSNISEAQSTTSHGQASAGPPCIWWTPGQLRNHGSTWEY